LPKQNLVIFIAGEGGHYEQAKRLLDLLELKNKTNIVFLTDLPNECKMDNIFHEHLGVIRSKQGFSPFGALCYFRKAVVTTLHYCLNYNVSIISTGPGISILPTLISKLFGAKIIHVETWSRFYSRSLTGKLMYIFSNKFYVQNKSLLSLYPKAIYSGRL